MLTVTADRTFADFGDVARIDFDLIASSAAQIRLVGPNDRPAVSAISPGGPQRIGGLVFDALFAIAARMKRAGGRRQARRFQSAKTEISQATKNVGMIARRRPLV